MFPKKLVLLSLPVLLFVFLAAGCFAPSTAQFGAPGKTGIKGVIVMPENNCYTYTCAIPQVSEGEPAAQAEILLQKEDGTVYATATADACGKYEIGNLEDSCYILYAKAQGGDAWVKKGIYPLTTGIVNDVGEANYYTTAQVIIYEVAKQMYPDLVKCSDIPGFVPTQALLDAVKGVLSKCKDAQQDPTVLSLARGIVTSLFGAPGGGGGGGTITIFEAGTPATTGGTPTPTPTSTPTPTPTPGNGGGEEPGGLTVSFQVTKTADKTSVYVGETITYTIEVYNDGNVPLTGISLYDSLSGVTPTYKSGDGNSNGKLDPEETWVYTYTYQPTTAGTLENTVTVDTDQTETGVTDGESVTVISCGNPCINNTNIFWQGWQVKIANLHFKGVPSWADGQVNVTVTIYDGCDNQPRGSYQFTNLNVSGAEGNVSTPGAPTITPQQPLPCWWKPWYAMVTLEYGECSHTFRIDNLQPGQNAITQGLTCCVRNNCN